MQACEDLDDVEHEARPPRVWRSQRDLMGLNEQTAVSLGRTFISKTMRQTCADAFANGYHSDSRLLGSHRIHGVRRDGSDFQSDSKRHLGSRSRAPRDDDMRPRMRNDATVSRENDCGPQTQRTKSQFSNLATSSKDVHQNEWSNASMGNQKADQQANYEEMEANDYGLLWRRGGGSPRENGANRVAFESSGSSTTPLLNFRSGNSSSSHSKARFEGQSGTASWSPHRHWGLPAAVGSHSAHSARQLPAAVNMSRSAARGTRPGNRHAWREPKMSSEEVRLKAELKATILSLKKEIDQLQQEAETKELRIQQDLESEQAVLESLYETTCQLLGELRKRQTAIVKEIDRQVHIISDIESLFGDGSSDLTWHDEETLLQHVDCLTKGRACIDFLDISVDDVQGLQGAMEQLNDSIREQKKRKKELAEDLRSVKKHIKSCREECAVARAKMAEKVKEHSQLQTKFHKVGSQPEATTPAKQEAQQMKPDLDLLRQTLQFCLKLLPKETEEQKEEKPVVYNNPPGSIVLVGKDVREDEFKVTQTRKSKPKAIRSHSLDKAVPFKHNARVFYWFEQLGMNPPMFSKDLPRVIAKLETRLLERLKEEGFCLEDESPTMSQPRKECQRPQHESEHSKERVDSSAESQNSLEHVDSSAESQNSAGEYDTESEEARDDDDDDASSDCSHDVQHGTSSNDVQGESSVNEYDHRDCIPNVESEVKNDEIRQDEDAPAAGTDRQSVALACLESGSNDDDDALLKSEASSDDAPSDENRDDETIGGSMEGLERATNSEEVRQDECGANKQNLQIPLGVCSFESSVFAPRKDTPPARSMKSVDSGINDDAVVERCIDCDDFQDDNDEVASNPNDTRNQERRPKEEAAQDGEDDKDTKAETDKDGALDYDEAWEDVVF